MASFEACKSKPVHATNPQLQPKRILPLFPDFDRYSLFFCIFREFIEVITTSKVLSIVWERVAMVTGYILYVNKLVILVLVHLRRTMVFNVVIFFFFFFLGGGEGLLIVGTNRNACSGHLPTFVMLFYV